jgi:hypothetical protein
LRGLPEITSSHELIDVKFNVNTYQSITSDEVAYMLQFRHGEEKRHPEIAIGSYVYMEDEDGNWKWWMLVHEDERPSFKQWQILETNWALGWVHDGKIYHALGVQRVSKSYGSLQDGSQLTTINHTTSMWLPTNADTLTLSYDQRVLMSDPQYYPPIAWSVNQVSNNNPLGLTKLQFAQTTFDPAHDNADLMLAGYYATSVEPTEPDVEEEILGTAEITYSGTKPTIKVGGSWKIFTPVFSTEGTTVDKWFISNENGDVSGDTDNYTIEYADQLLKIKVAQNYYLIGTVLIIQVIGSDGSTAEVSIEIVG